MKDVMSKVPAITLTFWIIKIAATTLGETGGDAVSMSLNLGYLMSSAIFLALFLGAVAFQIQARAFHPAIYWLAIVCSTTLGTTLADFCDRSLGIGYAGGSSLLLALVLVSLAAWQRTMGSISVDTIVSPKAEAFYWVTITFSQTLGTALGDWMADTTGLGYERGGLVFAGCLAVVALLYSGTKISRPMLFWAAFILTRPLGATLGDFLDKPLNHGGLALSRFGVSAALAVFIIACILLLPQRAGKHPTAVS